MVALWFSILAPLESFWPKKILDGRGLFGGNVFSKIRLDVMYCNIRIPLRSIIRLGKRYINYHRLCFSYLTKGPMFRCLSKVNEHGVAKQFTAGILCHARRFRSVYLGRRARSISGSVSSNRKSFEKMGPSFEVDHFSRSDRLEFWLNGSRP